MIEGEPVWIGSVEVLKKSEVLLGELGRRNLEVRDKVALELLSTERSYLWSLVVLLNVFKFPLKEKQREFTVTDEQIQVLFGNLEEIIQVNTFFLNSLVDCFSEWSPTQQISPSLKSLIPFLKIYKHYAINYHPSTKMHEELVKRNTLKLLFQELSEHPLCAGLQLGAYLILPVQRLPRYVLLLNELIKNTVETHPDYSGLKQILSEIKLIADYVNNAPKIAEGSENTFKIVKRFHKYQDNPSLLVPNRFYIFDGDAIEIQAKNKVRHFFIFSDMILVALMKGKRWTIKHQFENIEMTFKDLPTSSEFQIIIGPRTFHLESEEKEKFINALKEMRAPAVINRDTNYCSLCLKKFEEDTHITKLKCTKCENRVCQFCADHSGPESPICYSCFQKPGGGETERNNTKFKVTLHRPFLYFNSLSPNALAAQALLLQAKVKFIMKVVDFSKGEHKTQKYLELNPHGQVPTFVDSNGTIVFEYNEILKYIAEKYAPEFYPKDPEVRALIDHVLDWRETTWWPMVVKATYAAVFDKPASQFPAEEGAKGLTGLSPFLEGLLKNRDYLVADELTIADFSIGYTLQFLKGSSWPVPKPLKAYRNRLFYENSFRIPYEIALKDILCQLPLYPQEHEDITPMLFEPNSTNKLIVIGGGFAGTKVAMSHLFSKKKVQVLMIDTKDYWEFTPMVPRSLIQPERSESLIVPHDKNLKGKWFRGQVTEITKDYVIVDHLYIIRFNYLVIASGSRYPSFSGKKSIMKKSEGNMKDQFSDASERKRVVEMESMRLKNYKHIVVIGGGPVGIELMAELCTKWPSKTFTLISSQATFMPELPHLHKKVAQFFHNYNVNLRMGETVTSVSESPGKYTVLTDAEVKIEADRVYHCGGMIPNTEFMKKNFPTALTNEGFIKVNEILLVDQQTNIWALGDCNNVHEFKTGYGSHQQADYWIKSFGQFLKGEKVSAFAPSLNPPPIFILSLGPFRGVLTAGNKIVSTKKMAVAAKTNAAVTSLSGMNQDKALMKVDYDKLLAAALKDNIKDQGEESDEE